MNKVTALYFGFGFQGEKWRTTKIQRHIDEQNADGWHRIYVDNSGFSLPVTWRFFWSKVSVQQTVAVGPQ